MGDFNVAPSEPGYALIASGLVDAHRAVGVGPGWTWRPSRLEGLGLGLLRIDYVLSTSSLQPLATTAACGVVSDHCAVDATLRLVP